ncbi:MAG: glycosyltransferase [Lamprobacter sp.]|uniref:glycosyltransferase n=1 Tax=Lamprobacter sp. TaxID=3100796 RepID=UPI002B261EB6|nr:glycosyltransferase [Lamprobacter sp.]MEA3641088.1 glycosyltransferase [Lamprobacter sp.]
MKILHVLLSLAPRRGGPVSVVKALACAQAAAGHQVTIATTNEDYPSGILCPPGESTLCDGQVKVHFFRINARPIKLSLALARYLQARLKQFDLLHVHGLYRFPSTYAAYSARQQKVPYVIMPHGSLDPYLYHKSSVSTGLKRLYERWFDFPNLNAAGAIHYTAEDERRLVAPLGLRAPSFVVPNGIDWAPFEHLPPRGAFRAQHALGDAPVVLFLGRLHYKKGLDILIPAFAQVREALPDARLAIVGPSNDAYGDQVRGWVREQRLESAVVFVDFLSGADVVQAYVDADVFALPSYTENFGMTVVEAMACTCPVVISRHVNIHQEVAADGAGLVTDCDAGQVASAILDLLHDPERRQRMGEHGRRSARERYAWPQIVEQLTEEYRGVIDRQTH